MVYLHGVNGASNESPGGSNGLSSSSQSPMISPPSPYYASSRGTSPNSGPYHRGSSSNGSGNGRRRNGSRSEDRDKDAEYSLNVDRVMQGLDRRTTLMVRNIPNKYTQSAVLEEINEQFVGLYDFFYLPIDFKNKCNVGYAFINFIEARSIVPFFCKFNGRRWNRFNSEKVCAITYARIQGKASMISRFQNSSLMEKDGEYRPLLFQSAGKDRGKPEPFPTHSPKTRHHGGSRGRHSNSHAADGDRR